MYVRERGSAKLLVQSPEHRSVESYLASLTVRRHSRLVEMLQVAACYRRDGLELGSSTNDRVRMPRRGNQVVLVSTDEGLADSQKAIGSSHTAFAAYH